MKFGYIGKHSVDKTMASLSDPSVQTSAIRTFQRFANLTVTGKS